MYLYFYFTNIGILIKHTFVDGTTCIKVVMLGNINNFYSSHINTSLVKTIASNLILKTTFTMLYQYSDITENNQIYGSFKETKKHKIFRCVTMGVMEHWPCVFKTSCRLF